MSDRLATDRCGELRFIFSSGQEVGRCLGLDVQSRGTRLKSWIDTKANEAKRFCPPLGQFKLVSAIVGVNAMHTIRATVTDLLALRLRLRAAVE